VAHSASTSAHAGSARQPLVALARNLCTNFQFEIGTVYRSLSRKRTLFSLLHCLHRLRLTRSHRTGLVLRPQGVVTMHRLTNNPRARMSSAGPLLAFPLDGRGRLSPGRCWSVLPELSLAVP
jgi:hypothetical protein